MILAHLSLRETIVLMGTITVSVQCAVLIAQVTGRVTPKHGNLIMALISTVNTIAAHMIHSTILMWTHAWLAAGFWFLWWITGGGDDTKRRLRAIKRAFTPVRRTAPATA